MKKSIYLAAVLGVMAVGARAETGITNIVDGVTTNVTGPYYVGDTGPLNALLITNAGVVDVTGGKSIVGNSAAANSNNVWVTGLG